MRCVLLHVKQDWVNSLNSFLFSHNRVLVYDRALQSLLLNQKCYFRIGKMHAE